MSDIPTYVYPFIIAVIAAIAGRLLGGPVRDDASSLPGWILYAVALGCVIIGFATMWLSSQP
ncbi:hypothetical protein [Ramlibacter tataouinensis]|uniref:Uncharacterized protein n=1 Tax=Ramlibacter tataouinensis (strain ATCC BAA-407 / DSM 14655 / LMG 21543 / TTB310) TaxID=365046 RepID=F5XX01_RAMTT|nr:hypothetical protein [Ramlibacter tataouinensis]AEG91762.1 Hypothetical protein Rta_06840 [Ramlibacter tataouinensis TTB310]